MRSVWSRFRDPYDRTAGSRRLDTMSEDRRDLRVKKLSVSALLPGLIPFIAIRERISPPETRWQDLTHLSVIPSGSEEMDSPQLRRQSPLGCALSEGVPRHANRTDSHSSFSSPRT